MQAPAYTTLQYQVSSALEFIITSTKQIIVTDALEAIKDPCAVFDGKLWHIYGSGGIDTSSDWQVLHAISETFDGTFTTTENIKLLQQDGTQFPNVYWQFHAPGVIYDPKEKKFFFIIQTTFTYLGGTIEFFSSDDGVTFYHVDTVMRSLPYSMHAGVYDPHISTLQKRDYHGNVTGTLMKVFVFTGIEQVGVGKVYLAESLSDSWYGPWKETSCILTAELVKAHHNQDYDPQREWCTEGAQLFELDEELVSKEIFTRPIYLVSAVGFYPNGKHGSRQHNFFTASFDYRRNYISLGPIHPYSEKREMGHGSLVKLPNGKLGLYRQERPSTPFDSPWTKFYLDEIDPDLLYQYALAKLEKEELKYEYKNSIFALA